MILFAPAMIVCRGGVLLIIYCLHAWVNRSHLLHHPCKHCRCSLFAQPCRTKALVARTHENRLFRTTITSFLHN